MCCAVRMCFNVQVVPSFSMTPTARSKASISAAKLSRAGVRLMLYVACLREKMWPVVLGVLVVIKGSSCAQQWG